MSIGQDPGARGAGLLPHLRGETQVQVEGYPPLDPPVARAPGGRGRAQRARAGRPLAAAGRGRAGSGRAEHPEEATEGRGDPEGAGARVIAVVNQKGGVGKSTTAVNLGAALAEMGNKVLVVDLDPQGNASTGLGIDHGRREVTTYQVLTADVAARQAVIETPVAGLWAIPATIDLAGAEIELVNQFSREMRLRRAVEDLSAAFDFVFFDCPPSLGLLTVNALSAADELIVPIQCEYYALEGLGQLLRNVRLVQQNLNPRLRLSGILLTMFDPRTRLSEQVVAEVRRYFGPRVYDSVIPRTVRLSEAPGYGLPITHYDPRSKGAQAYRSLANEVLGRPVSGEPLPTGEPPRVVVQQPTRGPEEMGDDDEGLGEPEDAEELGDRPGDEPAGVPPGPEDEEPRRRWRLFGRGQGGEDR